MSKDSFFRSDNSSSMGLLALLNFEIETNEYKNPSRPFVGKRDPKWWIAVVLSFSGLFFGIAIANTQRQEPIFEKNRQDLRNTITKNIESVNLVSEDLSLVNNELAQIQSDISDLNFHGVSAENTTTLQIGAGLSDVTGQGFEIEINDAQKTDSLEVTDIGLAKVFDTDIQLLVNALWASGAEAITINESRLTTTSAIRSAGDAILVNYRPLLPPYKIAVIGDSKMKEKFVSHPDYLDLAFVVKTYGLGFEISDFKKLILPATGVALPDLQGITVGDRS